MIKACLDLSTGQKFKKIKVRGFDRNHHKIHKPSWNNYGWPDVSSSAEYVSGRPVAPVEVREDVTDPKRVWTPSIAPSGLAVYTGDRHPDWYGNLFVGGLVSKDIRRMQIEKDGALVIESRIIIGQRVRDIRQAPDGHLYVLTDEDSGQLIRLNP